MVNRFVIATSAIVALEIAVSVSVALAGIAHANKIPFCTYEDGNADGSACMWSDPDTGALWYVDSDNYRYPAYVDGNGNLRTHDIRRMK